MIICVYLTVLLLTATKLCDVLSTLRKIDVPSDETNPFARGLMKRHGTGFAAWGIFLLSLAIIGVSAAAAMAGGVLMQGMFVVVGISIAGVQACVAHCNWTGRDNFVTQKIHKLHA
jgi:hypothetical protein